MKNHENLKGNGTLPDRLGCKSIFLLYILTKQQINRLNIIYSNQQLKTGSYFLYEGQNNVTYFILIFFKQDYPLNRLKLKNILI